MNEDENAVRFVNRIKAAIDDYEAGRMSFSQLVAYTRRTSIGFDPAPAFRDSRLTEGDTDA